MKKQNKVTSLILCIAMISGCTDYEPKTTEMSSTTASVTESVSADTSASAAESPEEKGKYWFSGLSAEEIVSKLTLDQKIYQMLQPAIYMTNSNDMKKYDFGSVLSKSGNRDEKQWAAEIDKWQENALASECGLPFIYGQDDVHGVNYCKGAVIFPHNIGQGAANDTDLAYRIGLATADEAKLCRMMWNFSPCIAVNTDPRWGRTYECYSADIDIVSNLGDAYMRGLIDGGLIACPKHFFADGSEAYGTGEGGYKIDRGDAVLSDEQIDELLAVYKRLVDSGAQTIMISHGSVNGVKMHENEKYISILRNELGFDGMIVSDWESIHNISGSDFKEQLVKSINAGIDMLMEPNAYMDSFRLVKEAVNEGLISEERITDAAERIVKVKIQAGLIDDPMLENLTTEQTACGSEAYRKLAEEAVEKSLVLIKNDGSQLPLKSGTTIYITGPAANDFAIQCGGWTESWNRPEHFVEGTTTILEGFEKCAEEMNLNIITDPSEASKADVTLLFIGEEPYAEWNGDSKNMSVIGGNASRGNKSAIEEAANLKSEYGIPTVTCIVAGRQCIISDFIDNWDSVVMCYLPGSEGQGVANVLTGKKDFVGKLPMPWYSDTSEIGTDKCMLPIGYGMKY